MFEYIDAMPLSRFIGIAVLILALVVGWLGYELRKAEVDPEWSQIHDGKGRLIGVADVGAKKDLDGNVVKTRLPG